MTQTLEDSKQTVHIYTSCIQYHGYIRCSVDTRIHWN